jgi:hypothetical protein
MMMSCLPQTNSLLLLLLRNRLQVSMLDDKVWQVLAELPAPD